MNPCALAWLVLILYIIFTRYIIGRYDKRKTQIFLVFTCLITLIIYIYRMANYFPSYPPMVYYKNNIIMRIINMIKSVDN
jgi:branched-subunit amino acid permease